MGSDVGVVDGSAVGSDVGGVVGSDVGVVDGRAVGSDVGGTVGTGDGGTVGRPVGSAVGTPVGNGEIVGGWVAHWFSYQPAGSFALAWTTSQSPSASASNTATPTPALLVSSIIFSVKVWSPAFSSQLRSSSLYADTTMSRKPSPFTSATATPQG